MIHLILLLVLGLILKAANDFAAPGSGIGVGPSGVTLACGYLLLTAFIAGKLAKRIGLPKLTGYLGAGMLVGPEIIGLVRPEVIGSLRIFNGVAVALIALTAGLEMDFRAMRPLLRSILWITVVAVGGTTLLIAAVVFLAQGLLPFLDGLATVQVAGVALVLGVTMVAQSPAVVVALRDETDADGPLIRTVMGVVVIADLVVIILFAVVSPLTKSTFGAETDMLSTFQSLAWELFGSIGVGITLGLLIALYLRRVASSVALFVVAVSFVVAEVGQRIHLDPLLVMLAAGVLIRNATAHSDRLHHGIEAASLPVYVAFFAVAGATIHVHAIVAMIVPAVLCVGVRATGLYVGTRRAARAAGAPDVVQRFGGFGLMPQAGLALALALIFSRTFPNFGAEASALVFGVVALNELLAPIAFRIALVRSGEAGKRSAPAEVLPEEQPVPAVESAPG